MSTSHSLLRASDQLSVSNHLMEAVFMAASDLVDKKQAEAIQQVCQLAQAHLSQASLIIDDMRKGVQP